MRSCWIFNIGDAIGDAALQDLDKGVDKADGAKISSSKPKDDSVDKEKDSAARTDTALILQALIDRDRQKKKEEAEQEKKTQSSVVKKKR